MEFFTALIFPIVFVSISCQPLGADQTAISKTIQTVKQQKSEISQVGEFWTELAANFMIEGVAQVSQECVDSLGDKCTGDKLKQIASCLNSSSVNGDVSATLGAFLTPLQTELERIEKDLGDPKTDQGVVKKDISTMNMSRTDEESFAYMKNKAQSEFIVRVNPIVNSIPQIATECLVSLKP
uniref:Secreted protein n=1 Tax=Lygus hesperus TaxID=30085 RepID=A0A146L600_LYGHE